MRNVAVLCFIFWISACDQMKVERQIYDKEIELQELRLENDALTKEVNELNAQVARFAVKHPDGAMVEELRKALSQKEIELQLRESSFQREWQKLTLTKKRINRMEQDFYQDNEEKLIEIGKAEQLKKDYSNMQEKLKRSEDRVNYWLTILLFLAIGLLVFIMYLLKLAVTISLQRRKERPRELLGTNPKNRLTTF